jgi:ABC-type transporter Mla maintaining outer membrane lipid asymmetry ATPase subunit MlaF
MSEPIISLHKLHIAFGSKDVIKDLDLDVMPGETLAIIGPSGSGKSTILRVLIGLLKPSGGQVLVQGRMLPVIRKTNGMNCAKGWEWSSSIPPCSIF